eukprot:5273504-Prorocentrum_lima.AAC.1
MTSSLVGSEMCIRDRGSNDQKLSCRFAQRANETLPRPYPVHLHLSLSLPVSYTHLTLPTICSV